MAVKLETEGGVARREGQEVRTPAVPVEVKNTAGAGDSFDADFLYSYLQGWSLEKSLRFACACGSLLTRGVGGADRQATRQEAEADDGEAGKEAGKTASASISTK